ncbi:MAG: urea carboxylase-associated family protein [Spirochaetota bacterium]|nr:MAG: urea carboxylase-associated family protein [Spirochaetota bacterium]
MQLDREITIAKQSGFALVAKKNEHIRVIDVEGGQVADLVAFYKGDKREKISTAATIDSGGSLYLTKGDVIFSNRYNKMVEICEDTVGKHDILFPACSQWMYRRQYGILEQHPNCLENLGLLLEEYAISQDDIPNPFNIFMNAVISKEGKITVSEPKSKAGDYIELVALMDLIVAVSACSVEESRCNAGRCTPIKIQLYT